MPVEITVPQLGESIVEATVGRWLKGEGDTVAVGEPVVELETDKVNMEVAATSGGVLQSILQSEGETVNVGDALAVVDERAAIVGAPGVSSSTAGQTTIQPARISDSNATVEGQPESAPREAHFTAPPGTLASPAVEEEDAEATRVTPVARRMAAEHGVELASVRGTGPSGRVTREDVATYVTGRQTPTALPPPAAVAPSAPPVSGGERREERVRMSRRRQTIAQRLVEAQHNAAMLTTFNEVDMTAIMDLRKRRRDSFKERYGIGLGFMSFFTRAVISALKAYPRLNAEIQGTDMILKQYYDIGIAVGADEGLVVPVVRDADRLSFAEIEQQIATLATKAREGTLNLAELQGGTFTITNGGVFGSLLSTPILNTPQVGILGMHKIQERPIAVNGQVLIRPMMYLAMSYDHRIVDGSEAVRFLVHTKEMLEDPVSLLLES